MGNCPRCGLEISRRAKYCPRCAYPLMSSNKIRRCHNCGVRVAEGAVTCFNCGVNLGTARRAFSLHNIPIVIPTAPIMGAVAAIILGGIALAAKPWQVISVALYNTPTPTATVTPTLFPSPSSTITGTPTFTPTPELQCQTHRVRQGETLEEIAAIYGVTVEAIKELNGLTSDFIQYGTDIMIPLDCEPALPTPLPTSAASETASPSATPGEEVSNGAEEASYEVQPGDNLSEIAALYGVSVETIMRANGLSSDQIVVGQILIVPLGSPTPTPTPTSISLLSPTPTPGLAYSAPTLLSPSDGATYTGLSASTSILLNWVSVGVLAENEWYLVSIYYGEGEQTQPALTQLTKLTSFRLPAELRPASDAPSHFFRWQVDVVREVAQPAPVVPGSAIPTATPEVSIAGILPDLGTVPEVEMISGTGELRSFYWY